MFRSISRKDSSGPQSPAVVEDGDDDDAISVTSTVSNGHGSDDEFEVANVLAEKPSESGMSYLVEWEGFPLEECTWEPASNLGPELREIWEETKQNQRAGKEKPFDLQNFYDAVNKSIRDKKERHRRRNAKRRRLGLDLTEPLSDDGGRDKEATSWDDDESNEAEEDAHPDITKTSVDAPARRGAPPKQRESKVPGPRPSPTRTVPPKSSTDPRRRGSQGSSTKTPPAHQAKPVPPPPAASVRGERPSATGYQGTGRKTTVATKPTSSTGSGPVNAAAVARGTAPGRTLQSASRRVYTAKKSSAATKTTPSNVFIGGKTRKQRTKLADVLADSTKDQKVSQSYRFLWLAEKASRDKEDLPPNPRAVSGNLFDITKGPPSRNASKDSLSKEGRGQREMNAKSNSATFSAGVQTPPSLSKDDRQSKTKRKSVRFLPDDDAPLHSEPMDIDPLAANVKTPPTLSLRTGPQPGVGQSRLAQTQIVDKTIRLGSLTQPIPVTIHGIPLGSEEPWLAEFLAKDTLDCNYSCFAKTFSEQMNHLWCETLCAGTVTSAKSENILEVVAARLRAGMLGVYYSHPEYNLILYPTKCDEWRWLADLFAAESSSPNEGALKYFIFRSTLDCGPFLRPIPSSRDTGVSGQETSNPLPGREVLVQKLLRLNYADLLPPALAGNDSTPNFFLAFPQSKDDFLRSLYHWLQACRPNSHIYTSQQPGGWSAFRHAVEQEPGVVIVHELLLWSLRRFPSLQLYLDQKRDVYWCLSEASHPQPLLPSSPFPDETTPPGKISFTRLFPNRTAILITPSFLTSEPQRASELLDWFLSNWTKSQQVKLLAAWNLPDYLEELAHEKAQERDVILQGPHGVAQNEIQANLRGLSQHDCEERFKALLLATELHNLQQAPAGPSAFNEEASTLIYADPSIDPNDEQSLINWFGWWSSLRIDQFRGFHVVGSSAAMKYKGAMKGERIIQIPKYTRCTINSPDLVMDAVQQRYESVEPAEPAEAHRLDDTGGSDHGLKGQVASRAAIPATSWMLQSRRITREDSQAFQSYFRGLGDKWGFATLYLYPVSWTDSDMAQHFRDPHEHFRTMKSWFDFSWSFTPPPILPRARRFNTYIGFFYTITEEWDPKNPPPETRPRRRPWLAVYRPVNPFRKPYKRCELIIWDPAAKDKFPDSQVPKEEDLIFAQRHLIQLIREYGPVKNEGTWLDQVWLGGFRQPTISGSPFPIDITVEFLELMLKEIREYLPGSELSLPGAGYRLVSLGNDPSLSRQDAKDASPPFQKTDMSRADADDDSDDDVSEDEDCRIIFHPPRGGKLVDGQPTQCINRLYEEARLARATSARPESKMAYEFQHTLEWYGVQKAEGRGYEHINVASWEAIFNTFRIGIAAPPVTSGEELKNSASATVSGEADAMEA